MQQGSVEMQTCKTDIAYMQVADIAYMQVADIADMQSMQQGSVER